MADEKISVVIIGGGIAGLTCAAEVRKNSEAAEIVLVSEEEMAPYYRLNLIRYLAKEADRDSLVINPKNWYEEKRIRLVSGIAVKKIEKEKKSILLADGSSLAYDKLVLANGASPFVPPIGGTEKNNVITLRTIKDAELLLKLTEELSSCICIGAGILGLEVAGAIAKNGVKVTILENSNWLMPRQLNEKAAMKLQKTLEGIGIEVKQNAIAEEILGSDCCAGVRLTSGEVLKAELVIITAGVRPNLDLAEAIGLNRKNGIQVDDQMKTSEPDIFAAGDVTEFNGALYGLWPVAQQQGKTAAQSLLGMESKFVPMPRSNVLKVLGVDLFSAGALTLPDEFCRQVEKETENGYVSFILKENKIIGSIVLGDKPLSLKAKFAIDKETEFSAAELTDADSIMNRLMGK